VTRIMALHIGRWGRGCEKMQYASTMRFEKHTDTTAESFRNVAQGDPLSAAFARALH